MALEVEIEERMYVSQERSYHIKSGKRIRVAPGTNGIAQVRRFSSGVLMETSIITDVQTYGEYFLDMRFSVKCIAETVLVKIGGDNQELAAGSGGGDMLKEDNLSGLTDLTTARSNLGLGMVSIIDHGAVGDGVTNNFQAITDAMSAAGGKRILVPMDASGGDYAVTSGSLTLTGVFEYETGARIYASGGTVTDNSRYLVFGGGDTGQTGASRFTRGIEVALNAGNSGSPVVGEVAFNRLFVKNDTVDATTGTGSKTYGLMVHQSFGGTGAKGGRHAIHGVLTQNGITEATSSDRNYVGTVGVVTTAFGDGGTSGSEKGAYFGMNAYAELKSGATDTFNISGIEINSGIYTGGSSLYRSGVQIAGFGDVRGSDYDVAVSISNLGVSTTTWKHGILIGDQNGADALGVDSTAIAITQTGSIVNGLEITSPISGYIYTYSNGGRTVRVSPTAFQANSSNFGIELGNATIANTPSIDFHSSGVNQDYDSRIHAESGAAGIGNGTLVYTAATHSFTGGMKFGTYTADAAATIAGYITITDAGGTTRKLLVAA